MKDSKIEWTTHTFNPWRGCTKVSAGCDNCYAETMSGRNPKTLGVWGKYGTRVVASESMWKQPLKWDKAAKEAGERHRVFCSSLADVFEGRETMPEAFWQDVDNARDRLFDLIEETPNLDWLLLTKRPENVGFKLPKNVWIGTSVEDQKTADERIPLLLETPAALRWLSIEPLLGPVDLTHIQFPNEHGNTEDWNAINQCIMTNGVDDPTLLGVDDPIIDWVVVGGESGPDARPMHPDWARSIRDQCVAAGVPFFFKQWGEYLDIDTAIKLGLTSSYDGKYHPYTRIPETSLPFVRVGKKAAGRLLDGREWSEFPEAAL